MSNEKLDIYCEHFDALEALYSESFNPPCKKAPTFDNVAKYESVASRSDGSVSLDKVNSKPVSKKGKGRVEILKRELPIAIASTSKPTKQEEAKQEKPKKQLDNVITLAEKIEGPLAFLKNCMHHRVRLKVWTRNRAAIRGYCLGFVVAFDKHWNIALEDVTEVWTRKTKRKVGPVGDASEPPQEWLKDGPPVLPPLIVVIKKEKGKETCERRVKQLLVRGEHVALISVASPTQPPVKKTSSTDL